MNLGKNSQVREIKIRNLTRILVALENGRGDIEFQNETEKETYINQLKLDIERIKNA